MFREEVVVNNVTTEKKKNKRTCYGAGAFMAVFLSVALVLTSFDFTVLIVHAEESGNQRDTDVPEYVTDESGKIIIDGFGLQNFKDRIELEQKGTLEEVINMMEPLIWVNVTEKVADQPDSSESLPGNSESSAEGNGSDQTGSDESSAEGNGSDQPDSNESSAEGSESGQAGSSESSAEGDGNDQTGNDVQPSESSPEENVEDQPAGGTQTEEESQEQNLGENEEGEPENGDVPTEEPQRSPEKDVRERQWNTAKGQNTGSGEGIELLSEGGIIPAESSESAEEPSSEPTEGNPSESTEGNTSESISGSSSESTEGATPESTEGASPESTEENPSEPSGPVVENPPVVKVKERAARTPIDVTWECTVDYENTDLHEYIFKPVWDDKYVYEGAEEDIPIITVVITGEEKDVERVLVSSQEELQAALNDEADSIVMTNDIYLTSTLTVPASSHSVLDGGGYSLLRGAADDGGKFIGIMMLVEGTIDEEASASEGFILTNLCVNGRTDESDSNNRAGAPAIIVNGSLILEEDAQVKGNYNYGTKKDDGAEEISALGGGLRVYGRLRIREGAAVTGNFAEEGGGGVYLENGAGLYLHVDTIRDNKAGDGGKGTDLYASAGSFVSYAPSIELENKKGTGSYYIDPDAAVYELGPDKPPVVDPPETVEGNVEVFLSIHRDSGYSDEEIARLTSRLKEKGITVITPGRTDIDTTDLRNWYVYDHYEPFQWGGGYYDTTAPQAWQDVYGENPKRSYYAYTMGHQYYLSNPKNGNPVNTIEEWLGRQEDYTADTLGLCLAQFKEHIYSGRQNGLPQMTFVGYGNPAYVDFLYYDPESDGEKVVNFDIDSSKVLTHTLQGTGFLVNAGVDENGFMHGYLVYYTYLNTSANYIYLCDVSNIRAEALHDRMNYSDINLLGRKCTVENLKGEAVQGIPITGWQTEMSIQIVATPESIVVRQQPKNAEGSIDKVDPILTYRIPEDRRDSPYSGFGPLVAYTDDGHNCQRASAFTYSNLRMYFTNPVLEREDMLNPLQEADYTQAGDQRYFLNVFGDSVLKYNEGANFGQYQEFLYIMQNEGVALITDRESPFGDYLGDNLSEVKREGSDKLSIEELVDQVVIYIANKESTALNVEESGLAKAEPNQSVGNISLRSVDGSQIRTLKAPAEGYAIQIDDMSYRKDDAEPSYSILKPGAPGYAALDAPLFIVTNDEKEWPAGEYTIRQRFPASNIYGYSYFTLVKEPPASQPPEKPAPTAPSVSYDSEASEEFSQMDKAPVSGGAAEPKTGDRRLPPMPVAMGACTVFMLKLILWMYEMEVGITDQVKDEMLRALIDWAKGTTKPRILLALAVISVVLVIYHLLKEINARRKRMAVKRSEK